MTLADVKQLLRESMGLDAASIGDSAIEHAVRERQRACHLADRAGYWELVRSSHVELQALTEAVVVPETWFFRDREAFAELDRYTREWLNARPEGVFRVLSLPCSTGEEPYSMAMTLLDSGVPAARFRVDGVDISERALTRGRRGVFGKGSFRGADLAFRDRHFTALASGHGISDRARRQVSFEQGNLFSPTFLPGGCIYDAIFCRNVLIYFDRAMQERAIAVLTRLLIPTGLLFVGPSETGVFDHQTFVSAQVPKAFAFRLATAQAKPPVRHIAPVAVPIITPFRPRDLPRAPEASLPSTPPSADAPSLEEAMRLANRGQLAAAADHCETHLRVHGPSAEAYHVLGLMRDANGDKSEAVSCYRRALYLDPHHQEVLAHLALLLETLDQKAEAQLLRARAQRLARKRA